MPELLRAVRERGLGLAVATALRSEHLDRVLERAGLELDRLAGARAVFVDPADLLDRLDAAVALRV